MTWPAGGGHSTQAMHCYEVAGQAGMPQQLVCLKTGLFVNDACQSVETASDQMKKEKAVMQACWG